MTSKVENAKIETYTCNHKDTIYTITVQVEKVSKGDEAKTGGNITVLAWQPHTREPQPLGSQSHEYQRGLQGDADLQAIREHLVGQFVGQGGAAEVAVTNDRVIIRWKESGKRESLAEQGANLLKKFLGSGFWGQIRR